MKRTFLVVGAATAMAAATLIGTAGAASATTTTATANPNSYIVQPTGVHNAPSRQAPAVDTLAAQAQVRALCFIPNGEAVEGNTIWFRIATEDGNGWVPRVAIGGVPTNLPGC